MAVAAAASMLLDAVQAEQIPATQSINQQKQTIQITENDCWLAKLNSCTGFDGKLRSILIDPETNLQAIAAQFNLPAIELEIVNGRFFRPYFFSKLHVFSPEGGKETIASGSFKDTNVQLTLAQRDLTVGNMRLENWKNSWRHGVNLLFFIIHEKNLFQILPSETKNLALDDISDATWRTLPSKK
jgi:hypothetical protein